MNTQHGSGWFGTSQAIMFVAGIGFFVISVVALGILPGRRLEKSIREDAPQQLSAFTPAEARGRFTYATQGCAYCHTEQVRNTPEDMARWGPATAAWETKYESPQLWGTRRIGPDLAREAQVRSDDWQYAHLYDPSWIVPGSVMPRYSWMFQGAPTSPTPVARDLLAYLATLGRARIEAGQSLHEAADAARFTARGDTLSANPSRPLAASSESPEHSSQARLAGRATRGAALFAQYCSSCHGRTGDGISPVAAFLVPHPSNLTAHRYTPATFAGILRNGVWGSAMSAWRDLTGQDVADLGAFIDQRAFAPPEAEVDARLLAAGAAIYAVNCAMCHGIGGAGDGPVAVAAGLNPRPPDFRGVEPSPAEISKALRDGVAGTWMPPVPTMADVDRTAVTAYIASLYRKPLEPGY